MNRIAKTTPGLQARRLAAVLALALAPVALHGRQVTPFTVSPLPDDTGPTATLTPSGVNFIRITTIEGLAGVAAPANVNEAAATDLGSSSYLNKLGSFNFANDYPIISANLDLAIDSVIHDGDGALLSQAERGSFLMHQFSLLFVGTTVGGTASSFLISQNATLVPSIPPADDNFLVTLTGTTPSLEFVSTPPLPPPTDQIASLEWLGPIANDPAWDPDGDTDPSNDTFPTTADVGVDPVALADISFKLTSPGTPTAPLYISGAGQTSWDVYLFTTGPSLSGTLQLNLSQIIIALEVPESSHAIWGGLVLLGTTEVLRRRRSKRTT